MKASRSCDPELYQKVKESVSMQQAVEYCGLRILNGKCRCPFHKDTHPSMKIYPNGKGYYCFVCGAGGDQIRFVADYYGISNYEAAKQLAQAYGLSPIHIYIILKPSLTCYLTYICLSPIHIYIILKRVFHILVNNLSLSPIHIYIILKQQRIKCYP